MKKFIPSILLLMPLLGCGQVEQAELSRTNEINSNPEAYMTEDVRLEGAHVAHVQESEEDLELSYVNALKYVILEDESGRIKIWYGIGSRRCSPRLGATLTVTGKVAVKGQAARSIFVAKSISATNEPPLADNEVRLCQLSLQEQQINAEEGPQGLRDYWRAEGKRDRVVVYD